MKQRIFAVVLGFFLRKVRARYGQELARRVGAEAKQEHRQLLPHLPDVGGVRNYYAPIVIANGWFIATYKAMKRAGYTAQDTLSLWAELVDDLFRRMPGWLRVRVGRFLTSDRSIAGFHRQAERSQLRAFPADWVYQVNEVEAFDLALEFEACAAIQMYRDLGVEEMAPYCSFADVTYSAYLGLGLDATQTLGLGFPSCKLYYQRQGTVRYNARLQEILPAHLAAHPRVRAVEKAPS